MTIPVVEVDALSVTAPCVKDTSCPEATPEMFVDRLTCTDAPKNESPMLVVASLPKHPAGERE